VTGEMKIRGALPVHERVDSSSPPSPLRIDGLVVKCLDLTLADLQLMPQDELRDDFKCREGWMVPDLSWRGALLQTVFALARPHYEHVQASAGDFSISLPLDCADGALLPLA
jgi:DMSO/TMAO reductase YedYZ molybdopterin-dependent catalytic subunit